MKTLPITICLFLFSTNTCISQYSIIRSANYNNFNSNFEDPNLNPNWDWERGDVQLDGVPHYWIFYQDKPNAIQEYAVLPPWRQQSSWTGLEDRRKEDGWILLTRDFGTPSRRLDGSVRPYFVLYNKYRSVLRVFILLRGVATNFTYSTIELRNHHKSSGVLAHLAPLSFALDKIEKTYNNTTSAAVFSLPVSDYWVYGDFPMAFDYSLNSTVNTEVPASLVFDVYGSILTNVKLEMQGFSAQGDKKFIEDFMSKNKFGSPSFSLYSDNMPRLDVPFELPDVKIKATASDWYSMQNYFSNIKVDLNLGSFGNSSLWKGLFDDFESTLSSLSLALPFSISGIDLAGLFNFFVSGGMEKNNTMQTAPTFISSHYSAIGTLTTKNRFASVTIPVPAARSNFKDQFNGGSVGLISNNPFGILTLRKTPLLYLKSFAYFCGYARGIPIYPKMYELELAEKPDIVLNPYSNLELKKCDVSIVTPVAYPAFVYPFEPSYVRLGRLYQWSYFLEQATNGKNQSSLVELEVPIGGSSGIFRSLPVPIEFSKGRTLQYPSESERLDPKIKIVATLQRKNEPLSEPVVFIATYDVNIERNYTLPTDQALPTIPPQNVICNVQIGGTIISWNRNPERTVTYYFVERSINGNSYVTIRWTKDTVLIDTEIKKLIETYSAYSKNVTVSYRVKALSEWKDVSKSMRNQFSEYSKTVTAYGSINYGSFEKQTNAGNTPESDFISQNFPNPFNPSTTIYYGVKEEAIVTIKVFNSLGQEIAALVNERKEPGYHYTEWNASGLPSGVYFYRIQNGNYTETKRMVITK